MARVEETHFWFRGKRAVARRFLARMGRGAPIGPALEVGCGTGANLRHLLAHTVAVGLDGNETALRFSRERGARRLALADGASLPVLDGGVGLVLAFDVLEHLDDDLAALVEIRRVLRAGGHLLANVPAYPSLWSAHDEALGHRRRYRRGELQGRAREAGFEIAASSGWGAPLLPFVRLARARRRAGSGSDVRPMPAPLNAAFAALLFAERAWLRIGSLPAGLSWMVLARKP